MDNLVSVIVPVYNTAPYLDRCVQSILNQSYQCFELLLIDDGSTDASGDMCDAYATSDVRIRAFHKRNGGVSSARNLGLEQMRGDSFLFLDSDDSLEAEALQSCVDALAASGADVVVFGWQELVDGKQVNTGRYPAGDLTDMKQMVRDILADRHIYGGGYPNKLWRKTSFYADGVLPRFSEELIYVEDMEWVIRMLLRAKHIRVIEPIFYDYHLRCDSASRSEGLSEKRLIGYHDTLEHMVEDLSGHPDLQQWFSTVRYTELINSILSARMKCQKAVYPALYQKLKGRKQMLLTGSLLTAKMKLRLAIIVLLHCLFPI